MLEKPLLNKLSQKAYDTMLIILVILMDILLCAEADIYVPAFPQMIKYFGIPENYIQLVLSLNFGGVCIAGLLAGPLSDSFGRRKVLLGGLLLFVISGFGCVYVDNFKIMLLWRLIQGIAASVPMVVGCATFFDKYTAEKAGQVIGALNSITFAAMAGAPLLGAWITQVFNWRTNFVVILTLAIASFLGTFIFLEETLPTNKRKVFQPLAIFHDYIKILKNLEFLCYTMIVNFAFIGVVVYVANLSLILVNHMGMCLQELSLWQASTMGAFVIFSLASIKFVKIKGIDYTKNLGGILAITGSISILYIAQTDMNNIPMVCLSMAFIAGGGALMVGTFGTKALSVFPEMNGTTSAMMMAMRQLGTSSLVFLSELTFDGTIVPVAKIIFGYGVMATICYIIICLRVSLLKF